jgi:hypothetical protein
VQSGGRLNDRLQSAIRNRTLPFTGAISTKSRDVPQDPVNLRRFTSAGFTAPFVLPSVRRWTFEVGRSTFEGEAQLPPARLTLPNCQRIYLSILYCTTTETLLPAPQANLKSEICNLKSATSPACPTRSAGMSLAPNFGQNEPRIEPLRSRPRRIRSAARRIGSNGATESQRIPTGGCGRGAAATRCGEPGASATGGK